MINEAVENSIKSIDDKSEYFVSLSDEIWSSPELSLKEYKSAALLTGALKELGFDVETELDGICTAFSGKFGKGRPYIGILGEYDALSGLSTVCEGQPGHGCGHNLLGVGSLAAAYAVKQYLQNSVASGTVIYYGCPGEEGGSGKAYMARDGVWNDLDAALCWHPDVEDKVVTGTNNSSIQVLYKFFGQSAHAASCPELGRSALDAVELMNIGVQFLREHMTSDCRIHYSILDAGGVSPNVVQQYCEVLYMTRANKVKDCIELQKRVDDIAKGAALMTGTEFERQFIDGTSELLPNFTLERILFSNLRKFSDVSEHESSNEFVSGSTDVGDVSHYVPTAQIHVKTWPDDTIAHTKQAVECSKSELAHDGMIKAAKVLALSAIEMIEDDSVLKKAWDEFNDKNDDSYVCPIEKDAVPVAL